MDRTSLPTPSRSVRAFVLVAAVVVSMLWVTVKHRFEGPVVYQLTENHGIHRNDFLALLPPALACAWWRKTR